MYFGTQFSSSKVNHTDLYKTIFDCLSLKKDGQYGDLTRDIRVISTTL